MTVQNQLKNNNEYGVAIDFGSTTIALSVLDSDGNEITSTTFTNPQIAYGADVITRIKKCIDQPELVSVFQRDCMNQIYQSLYEQGISQDNISTLVISGNTIMQHILQGFSLNGFATAPFKVINIDYQTNKNLVFPPCFSAFVGADILCGANSLQIGSSKQFDLMIDLGTNGEMLLINESHGYATSTACGPVFDYAVGGARYGSDCIHAIAQCVKRGLIDKTGKIADAFFDSGIKIDTNFIIKQQNVRNFQLAKGAVLSGIRCLMDIANITDNDIKDVYICGGLGFYMEKRDAFTLNMFPKSFKDKIHICGNTSLQGATLLTKAILDTKSNNTALLDTIKNEYENLRSKTSTFELSNLTSFQNIYMNSLEF